jgi:pimeloyl-ACP methyl ester carboxylesterase
VSGVSSVFSLNMIKIRSYGNSPFGVVVVHGGPGAAGEMAPVAGTLSSRWGVIEPMQTAWTVPGQVRELARAIEKCADAPVALVGYSWGAWLGIITAARHPGLVKKLILVGCGPLEEKYAKDIMNTRLARLGKAGRRRALALMKKLEDPARKSTDSTMAEFGELMSAADTFSPLKKKGGAVELDGEIYRRIWAEASALRKSGKLVEIAGGIKCPVTAIHGEYDPHPVEGVEMPLSEALKDFSMIPLKKCGHCPWIERYARRSFYKILFDEIRG